LLLLDVIIMDEIPFMWTEDERTNGKMGLHVENENIVPFAYFDKISSAVGRNRIF
jgi:hypothetical protein